MRQRFVTGRPGTLRYLPPIEQLLYGAPSAAAISIRSARGLDLPTPVTDAPAAVDPTDTTTSTAAAAEDRAIVLASVASVKGGRHYLVTAVDGERFLIEVAGVNPVTKAALLYEPLARDLEVGATVEGVELSYALAGAQLPDPLLFGIGLTDPVATGQRTTLYRATWSYTIDGAVVGADQLYEVHKRRLEPTLTPGEVERRLPAPWAELSQEGPGALVRAVGDAWDDLLDDLRAQAFDPDRILDCDRLRQSHRLKTLASLATTWGKDWREWGQDREREYVEELRAALASQDWYELLEDAIQGEAETKVPPTIKLSR